MTFVSIFKRHPTFKRSMSRGATLAKLTPRGQWLYDRTIERFGKQEGGKEGLESYFAFQRSAEIGFVENFRFIGGGFTVTLPPAKAISEYYGKGYIIILHPEL